MVRGQRGNESAVTVPAAANRRKGTAGVPGPNARTKRRK